MSLVASLIYWAIVPLWLTVLATIGITYLRDPRTFAAARLLLIVLAIDAARNIVENVYFGLYFGGQFGLLSARTADVLGDPHLLILPKLLNLFAASIVLGLLLRRWLPTAAAERAGAVSELEEAEQRFKLLVDGVREYAIYLLDPKGWVTSWNSGAQRIKGYRSDEIVGQHFGRFYTADDRAAGIPDAALRIAEEEGRFQAEALRVRKDGTSFWASVAIEAVRGPDGKLLGFAKVTKDITKERQAEERLKRLALFDQLTGLPNRVSLLADVEAALQQTSRSAASSTALIMFGLDGFKDINDTLGHDLGDRVLVEASRRLDGAGGTSRLYRTGGDEFILILPDRSDPGTVAHIADFLLKRLEAPMEIDGRRVFTGASAGIATAPDHGATAQELIANADLALHDAKQTGGRRSKLFAPSLRSQVQVRQEMDAELRRAHAEGEFVLFFQPQLRMHDNAVVGAEALLRWRHPQRGLLQPKAFIEALAQSPVALEVGPWILRTACEAAASWRAKGLPAVRMGVNLFPEQFHDVSLQDNILSALEQSGLPPEALELEITENIVLGRDDATLGCLQSLRSIGVGLAFDDFGTGYASLSYLTRYPLTRIKIDRSFVTKVGRRSSPTDTAIVRSMILMAHNLGSRSSPRVWKRSNKRGTFGPSAAKKPKDTSIRSRFPRPNSSCSWSSTRARQPASRKDVRSAIAPHHGAG